MKISLATTTPADEACKGLVYRYLKTAFASDGRIAFREELRPMKSLSCPGCAKCGGIQDDLAESLSNGREDIIQFPTPVKHSDLVTLHLVITGRDWETGYADTWHYNVVPLFTGEQKDV